MYDFQLPRNQDISLYRMEGALKGLQSIEKRQILKIYNTQLTGDPGSGTKSMNRWFRYFNDLLDTQA